MKDPWSRSVAAKSQLLSNELYQKEKNKGFLSKTTKQFTLLLVLMIAINVPQHLLILRNISENNSKLKISSNKGMTWNKFSKKFKKKEDV